LASAIVVGVLVASGACACGGTTATTRLDASTHVIPIIVMRRGFAVRAYVRVMIRGHAYAMVLDSGAGRTVVTDTVSRSLRLPRRGASRLIPALGCSAAVALVAVSRWELAGMTLPKMVILSRPLLGPSRVAGLPVAGALGSDVLSRFETVTFEFSRRRVILGPSRQLPPHSSHISRAAGPLNGFDQAVRVTIDGARVPMVIDTGSAYSMMDSPTTRRFRFHLVGFLVTGRTAAGCRIAAARVAIPRWAMGSVRLPSALVLDVLTTTPFSALHVDGLLGTDVLSKFSRVTLDFARHRIAIDGPLFPQP
jgi:predicted aspartyl protease